MEGFLLHRRRFKETSLIVELFTFEKGRVSAIVKGALRNKSKIGPFLQPSIRLRLEFIGKSSLLTLSKAEATEHFMEIKGANIYSLLYINELLMRFTVPNDPVPRIYSEYSKMLKFFSQNSSPESILRYFELSLLESMGVKPILDQTIDGKHPISEHRKYYFNPNNGLSIQKGSHQDTEVTGRTLVDINKRKFLEGLAAAEAKRLLRVLISYHLDGKQLNSRKLFLNKVR